MATNYTTVEVWVCVDGDGDFGIGRDADAACTNYDDEVGGGTDCGRRMVKLTVKVPLPTVIELSGEVAADEEAGELKVA